MSDWVNLGACSAAGEAHPLQFQAPVGVRVKAFEPKLAGHRLRREPPRCSRGNDRVAVAAGSVFTKDRRYRRSRLQTTREVPGAYRCAQDAQKRGIHGPA